MSVQTNVDQTGLATPNPVADITSELHDISARAVGHGGFSEIYTGTWRSPEGEIKVAIKVIRALPMPKESGKLPRSLRREIAVLRELVHPNINNLYGLCVGMGSAPSLVSPWCENRDINTYLQLKADDPKAEDIKLKLFQDVLTGLHFLHEHQIIHGDIKGANVLISDEGVARLCDFGLSRILAENSQYITHTDTNGTTRWMAPELLAEGARATYLSDMWACGCLLIEIWSGSKPYPTFRSDQQVIMALNREEKPAHPSSFPDFIWSLIDRCCDFEPEIRPTPSNLMALIVFQRIIDNPGDQSLWTES
ncbi:kinase-like protein [Exidia glandulosa HHB12029]|uniref:Kinase-like protein n=1 Tax=Exidia glandulosa HHB12029 TaxID=1314781 RepID=A0A165LX40_EXIGL|nr:kinase-like protein [Exidia glandulosa HHB12029]